MTPQLRMWSLNLAVESGATGEQVIDLAAMFCDYVSHSSGEIHFDDHDIAQAWSLINSPPEGEA
tara:strand:+ start:1464 stop:1655 length:192 start_codon:yes stop_codon:yes gene_type:complete